MPTLERRSHSRPVYSRIARLRLRPGTSRDRVLGPDYDAVPALGCATGYRGMDIYADVDEDVLVVITRWETREQAETMKSLPQLKDAIAHLAPFLAAPTEVHIVETVFAD